MRDFLAEIKANNIKITVDDDQLVLKVQQNFNNPNIIAKIKDNKQELIDFISSMMSEGGRRILVPLHKAVESKGNLFFIHDGTGEVQGYEELIKELSEYNCYALRCRVSETSGPKHLDIKNMASEYMQKIIKIQPEDSYTILGWSTGGIIAYEIGRQLELANKKVEKVIMFDSFYDEEQLENNSKYVKQFEVSSEIALAKKFLDRFDYTRNFSTVSEVWDYCKNLSIRESQLEEVKSLIPLYLTDLLKGKKKYSYDIIRTVNNIRSLDYAVDTFQFTGSIRAPIIYFKAGNSLTKFNTTSDFHINTIIIENSDHMSIMTAPYIHQVVDELFKTLLKPVKA
ncbi:thioesterase domain-containing protein [Aquimarina intermedia]|uniref:Thioesterase domain-containing protein n=1 Tax=Aquimarina intermedia TaxID=350814 RepID=A0A5S5C5D5_9FLAO|nr:thioesterase domain-containing protein [Aquimarina intermedia]TYP74349.1 thioesterase domain-containing protein [Aquimarina intermedia]